MSVGFACRADDDAGAANAARNGSAARTYFMGAPAFRIEYSRFILDATRMRRTLYLVLIACVVAVLAAGYYYRHRAAARAASTPAAGCDSPAPPPPPKASEPKLPDFVEAGCAPAGKKK